MKLQSIALLGLLALCAACTEPNINPSTKLLSSTIWGKPEIVNNSAGYYVITDCGQSTTFSAKGGYHSAADCNEVVITGAWTWIETGKKFRLETVFNSIPQKTYIHTVVELTDNVFHTVVYEEDEPTHTWELKYAPRSN